MDIDSFVIRAVLHGAGTPPLTASALADRAAGYAPDLDETVPDRPDGWPRRSRRAPACGH